MSLENLGWKYDVELSDGNFESYQRGKEKLYINFDKRKITTNNVEELSFATSNAIIELVKKHSIY